MNIAMLEEGLAVIRRAAPAGRPWGGIICGSGWSELVEAFPVRATLAYAEIPHLGAPGVAGHAGRLAWVEAEGRTLLIFQGRRHGYEGVGWEPVALPVYALKQLGAEVLLLTNAAGSLRAEWAPGRLMAIDDHLNFMGANPLVGPHAPVWGARFPDQSAVYDPALRRALDAAARAAQLELAHGVYLAVSGPAYETPAEIRAFRGLGADAVGMSTVPEAMLARAAGLRVAGVSCITNHAAGVQAAPLAHEEVARAARAAMPRMQALVRGFWKELAHA